MRRKEPKQRRSMRVVRSWYKGDFHYYVLWNDGRVEQVLRKEAEQYMKAYSLELETMYGKPLGASNA